MLGFMRRFGLAPNAVSVPDVEYLQAPLLEALSGDVQNFSPEKMWREQPHLRTVTTFIARNISSTALHVFKREDDGGRTRVRDGELARVMFKANESQLMQQLLYGSIMDLCLYDEFIWLVGDDDGQWEVYPISPLWVTSKKWKNPWTLESLTFDYGGQRVTVGADKIIRVHGYRPGTMKKGTSPIDALKDTLREQLEAAAYRGALWQRGPRISGVIERPAGVKWDDVARRRFKRSWQASYSGRGSGVGGTPILEDGMKFTPHHLNARDEEIVEVAKLSLGTVASVYHVNPTMVGLLDNANYSNVREFRKSLFGDSLGPIIKQIEDTINAFLLPKMGVEYGEYYVEFNLEEKLRASFEEKAAVMSTAVGAPWLTVNEARAAENLPAVPGGDDLIVPLNVTKESEEQQLSGDKPPDEVNPPKEE